MYYSSLETSALLRQFIFKRALQISHQITLAAVMNGYQAAARREHAAEGYTAPQDGLHKDASEELVALSL